MPLVLFVRWSRVDKHRFLIGDVVGRLAMLVHTPPSGLTLLPLGEVSSPFTSTKVLAYSHLRPLPHRLSLILPRKLFMQGPT